jgi:hypothetical protein
MITKLIAALIIVVVLFCGWQVFLYWDKVSHEKDLAEKQAAASAVTEESLSGLPWQLGQSLQTARQKGVDGLKQWLKDFGHLVADPRKAWIELDYCVLVAREDLGEARRVYQAVKARTPPTSPVYPRIKQLAKTYDSADKTQ